MPSCDLDSLIDLSVRLGRNPLLSHACTGNTSLKGDGVLWIKASGTSLADARRRQIFTSLDMERVQSWLEDNQEPPAEQPGHALRPSIETPMHAVVGHRVVIHIHSINTIAWAVRGDGRERLTSRLAGLRWRWIPYMPSGLPLARAIKAIAPPSTEVFVLANHGLVIGADCCAAAEALLQEVEKRLAIAPRPLAPPDLTLLKCLLDEPGWSIAGEAAVHSLCTDKTARRIMAAGILYPCQAMFLKPIATALDSATPVSVAVLTYTRRHGMRPELLLVRDAGALISHRATAEQRDMLAALAEVLRRIPDHAPLRWLTNSELRAIKAMAANYRHGHEQESREASCLSTRELHRLYNAVIAEQDDRHVAIFTLACRCGMTAAQIAELRVADLDIGGLGASEREAIAPWLRRVSNRDGAFLATGSRRPISMNELDAMLRYYGAIAGVPGEKRRAAAIAAPRQSAVAS